jgi:hypothetical protein
MKKKLFTVFAGLALFSRIIYAQDIITKLNGDAIRSMIQEVSAEYVKYKKFDRPAGPDYVLAASEIFIIKYENGGKDIFEKNPATGEIQIRHITAEDQNLEPKSARTAARTTVATDRSDAQKFWTKDDGTNELPMPAEGETLYEGAAVFDGVDMKAFRVTFLLSADHGTMHNWKILYKGFKHQGQTITCLISPAQSFTVGKDTISLDIDNTKITGLTFVHDGATAKIQHKHKKIGSIMLSNVNSEYDFGTADIKFKILKGNGPSISLP